MAKLMKNQETNKRTIYLDNGEVDLEFANQYVTLDDKLSIVDVYILVGDKHEVSIMEQFETSQHLNILITDRVEFLLEQEQEAYEDIYGKDDDTCDHSDSMQYSEAKNVFEPINEVA